jgi:hypothetical protein
MFYALNAYLSRIVLAKAQLIATDVYLDRIAKRSHLTHRYKRTGRNAHIHEPPFERSAAVSHALNDRALTRQKIHQGVSHISLLLHFSLLNLHQADYSIKNAHFLHLSKKVGE